MDLGLFFLFLLTSFWFYGALVLALSDWRWNAGRILQYVLCAGLGAWLIVLWRQAEGVRHPRGVLAAGLAVFTVNVFLPALLQRRMIETLISGRLRRARAFQFMLVLLTWRPPSTLFGGLPEAALSTSEGSLQARRNGRMLARIYASMSRRAFLHHKIEALVASGFYDQAIHLFDSNFRAGRLKPEPPLRYAMAIAFSEAKDLERASEILLAAEEQASGPNPSDLRRFMAHLRVHSACGRVEQFDRILDRNPVQASLASPATIQYRRALAHLRAGDEAECGRLMIEALGRIRPGEEDLYRRIRERLQSPPEAAGPVALSPRTEAALDRVAELDERPPLEEKERFPPPRAVVTWAIILTVVAAWIVTEQAGSSESGRTLMQFGANVSALVRYGEWWRLVGSVFLHVGWLHLFFNAYACFLFGTFVERSTGRWQVFVVFLGSGIAGSAASAFLGAHTMSAGASGGVFGLVGAATVIALRFKNLFPSRVRRLLVTNFLFIAAIEMVYGLVESRIDNLAHGGGFAAGVALGFLLRRPGDPRGRAGLFRPAGVVLLATLAVASVQQVRYAAAGPYPQHLPPMHSVIAPDGSWKMDVPVFWESAASDPSEMKFLDPLLAELVVQRVEGSGLRYVIPEENEVIAYRRIRDFGTSYYYETYAVASAPRGPWASYLFQRPVGGYNYVVTFECPQKEAESYQPLLNRILKGLQVTEDPSPPDGDAPSAEPDSRLADEASRPRVISVRTCRACDRAFARRS